MGLSALTPRNGTVLTKICGLKTESAVETAAEHGADLIGFIFAPSRRRIDPPAAAALRSRLPATGAPGVVGVFVDEDPATVHAIADTVGLDYVQLCGRETVAEFAETGRPVIRAIRPNQRLQWRAYQRIVDSGADLLVDSFQPGSAGGSGVVGDWMLGERLARRFGILLAGGLTPENVGAAIASVRPLGVDVSSGVETAGVKDTEKIRRFLVAASRIEVKR